MFRTNFLKLKFWILLSNSSAAVNLENVNLLSNPNLSPKNGVAYKKRAFTKTPIYVIPYSNYRKSIQIFLKLN